MRASSQSINVEVSGAGAVCINPHGHGHGLAPSCRAYSLSLKSQAPPRGPFRDVFSRPSSGTQIHVHALRCLGVTTVLMTMSMHEHQGKPPVSSAGAFV